MNLVTAAVIGILFGAGVHLALKADLFRVVVGVVLISNAANLTLMGSGLSRGAAPIAPFGDDRVSDPLAQAMTLTALVIGLAVTALLLALALLVYRRRGSVDFDELSRAETRLSEAEQARREGGADTEREPERAIR